MDSSDPHSTYNQTCVVSHSKHDAGAVILNLSEQRVVCTHKWTTYTQNSNPDALLYKILLSVFVMSENFLEKVIIQYTQTTMDVTMCLK